jgi:sperm-associated antigen 16 protein
MEVIDDFIRNFFVKMGLNRTSEVFEGEWYELKATGKLSNETMPVPDVYLHNAVRAVIVPLQTGGIQAYSALACPANPTGAS